MPCVIALTLATALGWRGPAPRTLLHRESIILAREPLPDEVDHARLSVRAYVRLPGPTILYVTETPDEVLVSKPCLRDAALTSVNTPRVEAESRPPL